MTLVQEKEAEMVLRQKTLIGKLSRQLSQAKVEADKLKRLALKRLHSAFEHGEAEVEQTARSQGGGNKFSKSALLYGDLTKLDVHLFLFFYYKNIRISTGILTALLCGDLTELDVYFFLKYHYAY
jgi:hypothetical protein